MANSASSLLLAVKKRANKGMIMSMGLIAAKETTLTLEKILAEVDKRHEEFTHIKHIPKEIIDQFKEIGIYRTSTPACFGGNPMAPADFLKIIEKIAIVDGSTAWVASFGSANTYLASLPKSTQAVIYASSPDQVFSGALYPAQPAEKQEHGWLVNGRWKFASGCMGADWLGVGIGGGLGKKPITAIFPANKVEIVPNWDVVGLQGTGSHDLKVNNQFVSDEWTFQRGGTIEIDEPLYHYPAVCYQAQVHASVNLGLARHALNILVDMSGGKVTNTGAPRMADRAYFRIELAKAEATFRSIRAYYYEAAETIYESIKLGNDITLEQTNDLRMSALNAGQIAADVIQKAYRLGGMAAIYQAHPLQKIVRDSMVVTQHAFLNGGNLDGAGAVLTGIQAFPGYPS